MYTFFKRIIDIIFSTFLLILLLPLFVPIIIGLRLTGEGEIWYFQDRVGYKNKMFRIWKFATMMKNSENLPGGIITTKNDPRIIPLGGFLRKSKINELPQLINIFIGDMSFTGPRPLLYKSFEVYSEPIQKIVYNSKPGLTGIGSIIFRDEESLVTNVKENGGDVWAYYRDVIFPFKGELEKWYQVNKSFWVDLKILIVTAIVVVFPKSSVVHYFFNSLPKRNF